MLAQTATGVADALEQARRRRRFSRPSSTAPACRSTAPATTSSIYTRSLDDVTARLPEVVEATLALPVTTLIADGEAIALRPDGRPHRFQVTASRFGRARPTSTAARAAQPLSVFFFDVLHLDGVDLLDAADHASGSRRSTRSCRPRSASTGWSPPTPTRRGGSWTRRWPPATRA